MHLLPAEDGQQHECKTDRYHCRHDCRLLHCTSSGTCQKHLLSHESIFVNAKFHVDF